MISLMIPNVRNSYPCTVSIIDSSNRFDRDGILLSLSDFRIDTRLGIFPIQKCLFNEIIVIIKD